MYGNGGCPNCGYCQHCGRGGYWNRPYYPPMPMPYYGGYVSPTWTGMNTGYQTIQQAMQNTAGGQYGNS